mgnify:CR=1 FL=1
MPQPIILTCGEPAGIGPELAPQALGAGVPVVWMGDPAHLPAGTPWQPVERPSDPVGVGVLPDVRDRPLRDAQGACRRCGIRES